MKRLLIVGGGISGLAAAHSAAKAATEPVEIVVLEREAEVGGRARTRHNGGWLVETGPLAYLSGDPELDELVAQSRLANELRTADPTAANRFLVRGGELRDVSPHPLKLARSGILGPAGLLRILKEPFVPRSTREESVWEFANRRLGPQVADRMVAPMVLGVFAGDAKRLSLPAAFPRLAALEAEHGSLIRGLMKQRANSVSSASPAGGPAGPGGTLMSFAGGMQELPKSLAAQNEHYKVRCNSVVESVERCGDNGWRVRIREHPEPLDADALVLACEAWAMADLFARSDSGWLRRLREIPYPPVAIVALGLSPEARRRVPRGFGALIPRSEGFRMLGVLFDGYLFDGRCPPGTLLVRAFLGGAVDPATATLADADLITTVRADLQRLLGITEQPLFSEVVRWKQAIPQYEIGHPERVRAIDEEVQQIPGLFLAGNSLHGIAFGKAAAAGVRAGRSAAEYLHGPAGG